MTIWVILTLRNIFVLFVLLEIAANKLTAKLSITRAGPILYWYHHIMSVTLISD